jgi:hypothetical protein
MNSKMLNPKVNYPTFNTPLFGRGVTLTERNVKTFNGKRLINK